MFFLITTAFFGVLVFKLYKKFMGKEDVRMLRSLWGVVPADCKGALISEFLFNPAALRDRFERERAFQKNLTYRWR